MSFIRGLPRLLSPRVTSPATPKYNCIAWAAGEDDRFWWPDPLGVAYWPGTLRRAEDLEAFVEAFESLGFEICESDSLDLGYEKVAIYALAGAPKHAARQEPGGSWTSKLGQDVDISHSLNELEGGDYGDVAVVMRRRL